MKDIQVNSVDHYGDSAAHYCAKFGFFELLTFLIKNTNININLRNTFGDTPLHYASLNEYKDIVKSNFKLIVILFFN